MVVARCTVEYAGRLGARLPEAIRLVSEGRIDLSGFVSRVAPLAEGPEWFERLHDREPGLVKVVLRP